MEKRTYECPELLRMNVSEQDIIRTSPTISDEDHDNIANDNN